MPAPLRSRGHPGRLDLEARRSAPGLASLRAALLALALLAAHARADDVGPLDLGRLPRAWRVAQRVEATEAQRAALGQRLGVAMARVENVTFDACGVPLKVNQIACASEDDARALLAALERVKPVELLARRGATVVELVCGAPQVAKAARAALGLDPPGQARWAVALVVVPLEREGDDPTAWNRLFNLLAAADRGQDVAADVARLRAGFGLATALAPAPPLATAWTARPLEPRLDLPRVALEGEVVVPTFAGRPAERPGPALVAATPRWPSEAEVVRAAVAEATTGARDDRERVELLLGWLRARVRYDGEVGSRWGTLRVLDQGFGRCWDHSDVLITLCRAAGVPARQVYGWMAFAGGHVWCEAYLDGAWWPVDATASWVGGAAEHVPFFTSEGGEHPAALWGPPSRLERLLE